MYGIKLYVEGPYACFTRPEAKAERVSYEVPTPSACRGILESIHWKPAISWVIDKIHVLKPIIYDTIRRNELSAKGASAKQIKRAGREGSPLFIDINTPDNMRQQRASLVLRDVAYVIEAYFVMTDRAGERDNEGKHLEMFNRRARQGQCHHQPCFGCREFPAYFSLIEENEKIPVSAIVHNPPRELGVMLYDIDFKNNMEPLFYRPWLEHGMIDVAKDKEYGLCRHI